MDFAVSPDPYVNASKKYDYDLFYNQCEMQDKSNFDE